MPTENVLEVHHLAKEVGQGDSQLSILTGVELVVKPAQTLALIGESGSGKSTLLGILAGLDDGTSGEVSLLGQRLDQMDEEQRAALRARDVGFVFQSFMLVPTLTALENVQLPALLRGDSDRQSRQQAVQLLEQLGLGKRLNHLPAQLSGENSSAWRWRVRSAGVPKFSLPMSQPVISIVTPAIASPIFCFP